MLPNLFLLNYSDKRRRHIIHSGYLFLFYSLFAHFSNLFYFSVRKLGSASIYPISSSCSSFHLHIKCIICWCPKKKVRWFYTNWIVTTMTNIQFFIKRTIHQFIYDTTCMMRFLRFSIREYRSTGMVYCSNPFPTSFSNFNFSKKAFNEWQRVWTMFSFFNHGSLI